MRHVLQRCVDILDRHGAIGATSVASVSSKLRAIGMSAVQAMLGAATDARNPSAARAQLRRALPGARGLPGRLPPAPAACPGLSWPSGPFRHPSLGTFLHRLALALPTPADGYRCQQQHRGRIHRMSPQVSADQRQDRTGIKDQSCREDQDRQQNNRNSHDARTLSRAAAARKPGITCGAPSAASVAPSVSRSVTAPRSVRRCTAPAPGSPRMPPPRRTCPSSTRSGTRSPDWTRSVPPTACC